MRASGAAAAHGFGAAQRVGSTFLLQTFKRCTPTYMHSLSRLYSRSVLESGSFALGALGAGGAAPCWAGSGQFQRLICVSVS